MQNKGFTLIELLAVIVILATIVLVTAPVVVTVIEQSEQSTLVNASELYLDAVENSLLYQKMDKGIKIKDGIYNIMSDGNICFGNILSNSCDGLKIEISASGKRPDKGIIKIEKGKLVYTSLGYDDKILTKESNGEFVFDVEVEDEETIIPLKTYFNGEEVFIDVKTGKSCTNYHEDNSLTGYNGINPTGNQTRCLKFYAFLDEEGSDRVNLILDHNSTARVAWNSLVSDEIKPTDVINQLYEDTKDWKGTITPENYTMDQKTQESGADYTIKYSEAPEEKTEAYKARLITAQEIAKITGADKEDTLNWKEESSNGYYYLDGAKTNDTAPNWQTQIANSANPSDYYWLFDRTYNCTAYGCKVSDNSNDGYWTSSSSAGYFGYAWFVRSRGHMSSSKVDNGGSYGLRPVITVLKKNIQ